MQKKAQLQNLGTLAVGIAVLCITLVIAFLIIGEGQDQAIAQNDVCGNSSEFWNATVHQCCQAQTVASHCGGANLSTTMSSTYNATATLAVATSTIPQWVPIIVIAVIGSVLLSLVALFVRR